VLHLPKEVLSKKNKKQKTKHINLLEEMGHGQEVDPHTPAGKHWNIVEGTSKP
jgi:preprotein translocase subunit YajC